MMSEKVLIAVSLAVPPNIREDIDAGIRPRVDYLELADALNADVIDYSQVALGGRLRTDTLHDLAVAVQCFRRRHDYDVVITMGEAVGIPLGLLNRSTRRPVRHLMISHYLSSTKKAAIFKFLRAHHGIDVFFPYSQFQASFLRDQLHVDPSRITPLDGFIDVDFFTDPDKAVAPATRKSVMGSAPLVIGAGLESRDYPTLASAAAEVEADFIFRTTSPWTDEDNNLDVVPENVRVDSNELPYRTYRDQLAVAHCIVVSLRPSDYAAGLTTGLEAGALGIPLVITASRGMAGSLGNLVLQAEPRERQSSCDRDS